MRFLNNLFPLALLTAIAVAALVFANAAGAQVPEPQGYWMGPPHGEVPDTLSAIYEYPKDKLHLNYSCYFGNDYFGYGEQFLGSEGMLEVIDRKKLNYYPQMFNKKAVKEFLQVRSTR